MMMFKVMVAAILVINGAFARNQTELRNSTVTSMKLAENSADLLAIAGPFGGDIGDVFSDRVAAGDRAIVGFEIRSGNRLDNIRVLYEGAGEQPSAHGSSNGGASYFGLNTCDGEVISRIELRAGADIDGIQFFTNHGRNSQFYGGTGGGFVAVDFGSGGLQYIEGRAGNVVHQLEFHY